jgi:hypothetical protein
MHQRSLGGLHSSIYILGAGCVNCGDGFIGADMRPLID